MNILFRVTGMQRYFLHWEKDSACSVDL